MLEPDVCYRALRTRDARFDGRFFTAVRTTGVYCRPICPAPTPRRENCLFLPCAAAAQEAGFRPCLRCRPEASPGTPAWLGSSASVSRALRLIADGALDAGDVGALAQRLGMGERHLRRLFLTHLGASPGAVAQTRRLLFAKKLLDETTLPVTEVALAAGYSSIRRFNAAVREAYGRSPRELRRSRRGRANGARGDGIELRLAYRPPFDWPALLAFFAARCMPGVERVEGDRYLRSVRVDAAEGLLEVRADPRANQLVARLRLDAPASLVAAAERVRRSFDLGADPAAIAAQLERDRRLARRLRRHPGVRVPGSWDGFELAVRAILGQQVSVQAARVLAGRLAAAYGRPLRMDGEDHGLTHIFPTPEALCEVDPGRVRLPRARAAAISSLAHAIVTGELALDGSRPLEDVVPALQRLPGVGPWTAQVIAMRALREPDAFPSGDLGVRRALGTTARPATAAQAEARSRAWRPWRAYAAVLLWHAPR